jgi:outer membrane protein assembly factor BamA
MQMRTTAAILILALAGVACAQAPAPQAEVRIRTLTVVSADLSTVDRQRIAHGYEGETYVANELEESIRTRLRDLGYYNAQVDDAVLSAVRHGQSGVSADVAVHVAPGAQYRFGVILFHHATVFPPDQIRLQFPIRSGSLFNATGIGFGLERLRSLYEEKGYINFAAIPKPTLDDARHIVDLTIDIDEGKPYSFGHLLLDGVEPHAGAGQELTASWSTLQGKIYNPESLKNWLASNWPTASKDPSRTLAIDNDQREVNFRIQFP